MTETTYDAMNRLLEECGDDDTVIRAWNDLLVALDPLQEDDLVHRLSECALARAGALHSRLRMHPQVREHLLWGAYSRKCVASGSAVSDALLDELIADYDRYHFVGLESVAILCLKRDALTEAQAGRVEEAFRGKAVAKQILRFRARRYLAEGGVLDEGRVRHLLAAEAYDVLEQALDRRAIAVEALHVFQPPRRGERNRKHKLRLHQRAQRLAGQEGSAGASAQAGAQSL